ncbi:carboxypeptidase B-like [Homarus americanus]|uniref:carboxypeptidase B-like n=1 Tax=Homarus americanus TaxID=6706 RepID=UPI001C436839|nr:carboxypeptidase B-like [Homarus americanus]
MTTQRYEGKKMKLTVVMLLGVAALTSAIEYQRYKVVSVRPRTHEEVMIVEGLVNRWELDQWSSLKALGTPMDIMVSPRLTQRFLGVLRRRHIPFTIKINDVQALINTESAQYKTSQSMPHKFDHADYHRTDEIYSILKGAETDFPDLVTIYTAATTYEGRDIRVAKVSTGGSKPVIWIDCGIHAREWIAHATCQYILDQLTSGSNSDSEVSALLDSYDFHIMPVVNPDGYEYTWTSDRLWRKNRVPNTICHGVDCNRNFDSDFGGIGTSDNPCSDLYHGKSAFSEKESQVVRDSIKDLGVKMFVTIHSYSQLWMTPYGYTNDKPANYDEQYRVAGEAVVALEAVHGTRYQYGNIADVIYMAAGGSIDWAYDSAGVEYAFGLELRDTGSYGFLLPKEQIIPTGEETWAGIKAAVQAI